MSQIQNALIEAGYAVTISKGWDQVGEPCYTVKAEGTGTCGVREDIKLPTATGTTVDEALASLFLRCIKW
jgi:hypothetical protein